MRLSPAMLGLTLFGLAGVAHAQPAERDPSSPASDRIIVFFAWDRPIIDGDAAAQLDAVVMQAKGSPDMRIVVSGHADRSGPAEPNVRSARGRAEAVRAYLHSRGVRDSAMRVHSFGETRPLIATADGVREPQNRRVEVAITRVAGR